MDYADGAPMPMTGATCTNACTACGQPQTLPAANVFELQLAGGAKLIVRPSGTEPKIKAYVFASGATPQEADALADAIEGAARELLQA